jgi:hypothetical protein
MNVYKSIPLAPQNFETTPLGQLKNKTFSKLGLNKDEPNYVIDVGDSMTESPCSGTVSWSGGYFTGVGTAFTTEFVNGATLQVISTGETYTIAIASDTQAYQMGAVGAQFSNEACVFIVPNKNFLNILDLVKLFINNDGKSVLENNEFLRYNNQRNVYRTGAPDGFGGVYKIDDYVVGGAKNYRKFFNNDHGSNSITFGSSQDGSTSEFGVIANALATGAFIDGNGVIRLKDLPTTSQGADTLYKENGFLKIG